VGLRVGIDLVEIGPVRESVEEFGARYLERVYTEREVADCTAQSGPDAARLAARFAAKEATLKVLRPSPDEPVPWRSIEVVRAPGGWVELELHDAAAALAARAGMTELGVSLTHERDYASAVVVAQSPATPETP
jgi:holo-[acyl-carrier protein] synthase